MFNEHAAGAIAVERSLHESFFADFGVSEEEVAATPMAPTNLAYTSYLLASVYGASFPEALGAVLPCCWIYWEVGKSLLSAWVAQPALSALDRDLRRGRSSPPSSARCSRSPDRLGPQLAPAEEARMHERFRITSRYEWMFWEMGYRWEPWPVGSRS